MEQYLILSGLMLFLAVAILFVFYRVYKGPSVPDRMVALDLISSLVVGAMAVYAIMTHDYNLLDVAMVLALLSFLGTVAVSFYVQRRYQ